VCLEPIQKCFVCKKDHRVSFVNDKTCVADYKDYLEKINAKFITMSKSLIVNFSHDIQAQTQDQLFKNI
jgi:hypothetical protein